jgi:cob(I)alamin adenosyltransferase
MKVPVILIAIIAAGSLVQILFVAAVAWKGMALARGLGEMKKRLLEDLGPALRDASRIARNASILSEMTAEQMSRVDAAISGAMGKVDEIRDTVAYQMDRLGTLAAVARSVARGIATLRGRRAGR